MPILGVIASSHYTNPTPPDLGAMFPLGMVQVGSGGAATISFTGIPSTYTHLQLRGINRNTTANNTFRLRFNSDTGSNYTRHFLYGNGTSALAAAGASQTSTGVGIIATSSNSASIFSAFVIDILDYKDTSKYKTMRSFGGYDANGSGNIGLFSGVWMNTAAITSISLLSDSGDQEQYTQFALYGIKGA
jgi:hypothetical protein